MGRYLLRRLASYLVLVAVAASLTYFLAGLSLNPRARFEGRNPPLPEAAVTRTLDDYNLNPDTPVVARFARWAGDVAHGDLGRTIDGDSVNDDFGRRVGVSARLLLLATLAGSALGVAVGAYGAIRQYRLFDRFSTLVSFFVLAMPVFVIGVALKIGATALNEGTQTIKVLGEYDAQYAGRWDPAALLNRAQHMLLPALTLIIVQVALYSRYQRSTMLDVLGADFLRTARAKGLRRRTALVRHGLRTAVLPVVPLLVYNIVLLFAGATFVEKTFGWHGMGELLVDSVAGQDVNSVAAVGLFAAALVVVAGLLADLLYAALDPRVRVR
ncbi:MULTISPECIES: ABC transporter permease [Streptomyces]|uniref:ABC transporter permease n=2 Tax=Streptomyces rimosus subsp. rimosus TaxID=132474 RepID=L8EWV2_STRR1|nr:MULTISPECIES: ABC transporter permease [Streptomyces]KOG69211.1 peptide ABC transporter permease [Kitasatospora aureofaciens]MYT43387.1 ABC transporter permease subunit [Streptomyces sp. SID5471]KEF04721.1 peptide ABC transporter permease [Streptomyces rimosus]KEF19874.1 peptide ABC transporter permease [Streptomyces rimosus]KOT25843.1 peptide ABC transporter permease [Streptomyces rimosus subsp. rimosus]